MNGKVWFSTIMIGVFLSLPISAGASEDNLWIDGRIGIQIDKLERSDSYPDELRMPGYRYKAPKEGEDYFFVKMIVVHIHDVHLGMPEQDMPENPHLLDTKEKKYEVSNLSFQGVDFKAGLQGEDYEVIEGATGHILFVIGEHAEPAKFVFTYPYWESWKEKEIQYGKIEIDLTKYKPVK